jgi:hypothetical protein
MGHKEEDMAHLDNGRRNAWIAALSVWFMVFPGMQGWAQGERIQPSDLIYLGGFHTPEADGASDWTYSGNALAHFPAGDPRGGEDGFPGSLFATGNDTHLQVAEISIPVPVVSSGKRPQELNTARMLRPFADIFRPMVSYMEQPRAGLCFSESGGGRLHYSLGMHLQETGFDPSHGWFDGGLSRHAGPWVFGNYSGYVTNDYMCTIPDDWAAAHTPGQVLACGRGREGPWAGGGPALFAYAPPQVPPGKGAQLTGITPLLLYGEQQPGLPEIAGKNNRRMRGYSDSDRFRGVAWLTAGKRGAVVFTCTKAIGKSWYGFANGVPWDYACGQSGHPPCPPLPEYPYDNRGFWADDFQARLLFYDPAELAAVAAGRKKSWEPQPYAEMDLSPFLFDPDYTKQDLINYKRDFVGAATFDRDSGLLYLMEPLGEKDGRSIVHVFRIR